MSRLVRAVAVAALVALLPLVACGDDSAGGGGDDGGAGGDDAGTSDAGLHPSDAAGGSDAGSLDAGMDGSTGCPDEDGDTVCDVDDLCPGSDDLVDGDGDGVPDGCDICPGGNDGDDGDLDGVPDVCDVCPGGDDTVDPDADGVASFCDNCPDDSNPNQNDLDGDGDGNACDNCRLAANSDQADGDGDGDGDVCDNCPGAGNPTQDDGDGDGDGDGCDNCPSVGNSDQADFDTDTVGDACDNCPGIANSNQADFDTDSIGDACDNCPITANQDQANSHGIAAIPVAFTFPLSCDDDGGTPGIECTSVTFTNELSSPIPLSFDFAFFGTVYTHVRVSSNGLVYLGTGADSADFAGVLPGSFAGGVIPLYDGADTLVAGVWTDISNPVVTIDQLGAGSSERFIVNFSGDVYSSQIAFFETSNQIQIRTPQLAAGGSVDTRGIEGLFDGDDPAACNRNAVCGFGESCFNCALDCCGANVGQDRSVGEVSFGYVGAAFLSEVPLGSDESAADFFATGTQVNYTTSAVVDFVGDACDNVAIVPACGDGVCNAGCNTSVFGECETAVSCPAFNAGDCSCGDGVCDQSEFIDNDGAIDCSFPEACPQDCAPCCGDEVCDDLNGENAQNCQASDGGDCGCGDGICDDTEHSLDDCWSDSDFCPFDCSPCCGDQFCDFFETCGTCGVDCLNGVCDGGEGSECSDICECTENGGGNCGCFCPG